MAQRIGPIVLGYVAACSTAGLAFVVSMLLIGAANQGFDAGAIPSPRADWLLVVPLGLFVAMWAALFALIPSLLVIALAEWRRVRGIGAHLVFGALIGMCAYLLFLLAGLASTGRLDVAGLRDIARAFPTRGSVLAAAGLFGGAGALGGLVYQRIAGRNAGLAPRSSG